MSRFYRFLPLVLLLALISGSHKNQTIEFHQKSKSFPNDWFFMQRAYPTGKINHQVYVQSLKQTRTLKDSKPAASVWDFAGPINSGGRITDVESHPDNPEIYIGAASGGIFRLPADAGSWESIFDDALSLSIGDIAIAPSDPEILYVGTGEANCGGGSQTYDGVGIYKSTDGGDSWSYAGLEESRNIGRLVVHPDDPDIVYAAAMGSLFGDSPERGIYKTTDGGANWEKILFISDSTGGIDLVMHPESNDTLYAAMWERIRRPNRRSYGGTSCGIYKTTDGGTNWEELVNGLPSPGEDVGRIGIDISRSDPETLYAIYADDIGYFKGVYITYDGGGSWTQTNDGSLSNCYQSYGWWFGRIKVDPLDPDIAYVIGFDLYKTTNGGNSWNGVSSGVHVDQHELFIHPNETNRLLLGNDGGLYISENAGITWEYVDILPITQFYTCEIDEQFPERLYGGTQDNGTNRTLTGDNDDWDHIYGGDGFYVLVDPLDNDYVYAEYQYGGLGRSTNGGYSFSNATEGIDWNDRKNWNTPVVFDPVNPEILYYGSEKIYRSSNRAVSWTSISPDLTNGPGVNLTYGTITTISVSPVNQDIIYAGTDDGNVWVTLDGGNNWTLITEGLPNCWVTRVTADPLEEETVYVTFSGYRWDEYIPHVFRSEDSGENWVDISSGLPETPLNDIIVDPMDNQTLYVASDAGVFISYDLGENWDVMGSNLPLTPVNDLDLHNETRKLVAATYGRSMYSYDLYQDTISTGLSAEQPSPVRSGLTIFPNPINDLSLVRVELSQKSAIRLYISDLNGRKAGSLLTMELQAGIHSIDPGLMGTGALKNGIYLLVLEAEGNRLVERIIVRN